MLENNNKQTRKYLYSAWDIAVFNMTWSIYKHLVGFLRMWSKLDKENSFFLFVF